MQATISKMSGDMKKQYADLYNEDPETVKRLCDYPGVVGTRARLCVECAGAGN